ncbi:division/cell wall cluster transcriptional repressor MraZ [Paraurantiacibacter namhicola]|uniref:Cell division protein MraZ n=1 Tax=Paraurantiacibacter namhicola TaxID=645517 RepID=A0A1C7DB89_9SPHN|nr:division/cell wall cluster transcriptional repressor MraZ [Paraurantiacibacter namhicola]ANU08553.1 cell division protein MraZ [Paraurantiacibacter namhicola]
MAKKPSYGEFGFALRGEKNRFALPPDFRKAIHDLSGERVLCLAKHESWPCLVGFDLSYTETFEDTLDREEERAMKFGRDFDRGVRAMQLYGYSKVPFDASGRFILPDYLLELGNLRDAVYLQGLGDYFTLWDPEALEGMGPQFQSAQAKCREMHQRALAKAGRK